MVWRKNKLKEKRKKKGLCLIISKYYPIRLAQRRSPNNFFKVKMKKFLAKFLF